MAMYGRDYRIIAGALHREYRKTAECTVERLTLENAASELARAMKADNGRFDADRFLTAVKTGKGI